MNDRLHWLRAAEIDEAGVTWRRALGLALAVGVAYVVGAELSWQSFGAGELGPAFFPPAGVTLAALVLLPTRRWTVVLLAVVLAEVGVDLHHDVALGSALGYAAANTAEPLVGATLLRGWMGRRPDLEARADVRSFLVGAVAIGPLVGGAIGSLVRRPDTLSAWTGDVARWATGDGLGVIVVALPLIFWGQGGFRVLRGRAVEMVGLLLLSAGLCYLVFWHWEHPPAYLVLPLLLLAVFRLGLAGVTLTGLVVAGAGNYATATGRGGFALMEGTSPATQLSLTQLAIASTLVTAWLFAVELRAERRSAEEIAWERAMDERHREELRQERIRLALARLATRLADANRLDELAQAIADGATRVLGAAGAVVELATDDETGVEVRAGAAPGSGASSGHPLLWRAKRVGFLQLVHEDGWLTDELRRFANGYADMCAQVVERVRLAEREHDLAVRLQRALLGAPDRVAGFRIGFGYLPADNELEVGGDWYDVVDLGDGCAAFVVGDVVGHSLSAAVAMGQVRSATRALAASDADPAATLAQLDRFAERTPGSLATSMIYVTHDEGTRTMQFSCAGLPPPLVLTADGTTRYLWEARSAPLCSLASVPRTSAEMALEVGDTLLLYTDGLVERRGEHFDTGLARLEATVAALGGLDSTAFAEAVLAGQFRDEPNEDDVAILVVQRGVEPAGPG